MIFLKKIFKRVFIAVLSLILFFGVAYAYLHYNFNNATTDADQKDYTVPYERRPQNCGIAFVYPNSSATLVYLDFENTCIRLLDLNDFSENQKYYRGYSADYSVKTSYELIEGLVDRVGGVNIEYGGELLRYTGVQVIDLISNGCGAEIKNQILAEIFKQISKNNFSKEDFVYIIENSESNLSIIDCIYWLDYIKDMSGKISFID